MPSPSSPCLALCDKQLLYALPSVCRCTSAPPFSFRIAIYRFSVHILKQSKHLCRIACYHSSLALILGQNLGGAIRLCKIRLHTSSTPCFESKVLCEVLFFSFGGRGGKGGGRASQVHSHTIRQRSVYSIFGSRLFIVWRTRGP